MAFLGRAMPHCTSESVKTEQKSLLMCSLITSAGSEVLIRPSLGAQRSLFLHKYRGSLGFTVVFHLFSSGFLAKMVTDVSCGTFPSADIL